MTNPTDGSLRVENLRKTFASANGDGTEAGVHDVSFEVPDAKGFTLLGPSGCGKTTTLRMIGGLETPSSGRIVYDGRDITHLPPQQRDVRTVFQRYALFPHLPVSENIAFGLRMQKRPNSEVKERVAKIAELIEIRHLLPRRTSQLSGGEQQRVALARALITEPGVLLLDEPLSALDLKLRERMQLELLTLRKKLGTTFIFVTHDQTEAMVLSDLIGIMNRGRLEQVGSPEEIYTRPKTRFVAQFIGQANFLGQEQAALLKGETEKLPQLAASREWMLRPESVIPRKRVTRLAAGLVALPGRITELAFLGQDRLAKVLDASGRTHLARFPGHEPLSVAENDEIYLTFKPESVWSVEHSS